jgi:uncharacterized membrane protein YkvA (DUF1232 family)
MIDKIKAWARQLKKNLTALYYVQQHPHTPWYCRLLIFLTLLYALSPIDLIPDFIPVLGLLDDLLLLPLAIYLTIKLLPEKLWLEHKLKAEKKPVELPRHTAGILLVAGIWLLLAYLVWIWYKE